MKTLLLCLGLAAATPVFGQPNGPSPFQGTAESDRLMQEFMAERAKMIEARAQLATKAKKAKADKDTKSLKAAQDEAKQLESDFLTRTAELSRQIKVKEAEKKAVLPADAKKNG